MVFFHRDYGKGNHLIHWYSLTSFWFLGSISLVLLMIPLAVGVKAYLIYFLLRRVLEVVLLWIVWKKQSFSCRFLGFWNCGLRTDHFNEFYKRVHLFLKKDMCQTAERKSLLSKYCIGNVHFCLLTTSKVIISSQSFPRLYFFYLRLTARTLASVN